MVYKLYLSLKTYWYFQAMQMKPSEKSKLNSKQQRAVLLLALGFAAKEVGRQLKVAEGTVHNWKSQNEKFRDQLRTVQQEMFSNGVDQLNALVSVAASTLANVMNDKEAAHRDKIAAARTVLQHCAGVATDTPVPVMEYADVDDYLEGMGLQ
jgi:DNA-binding CsgD family transcriptional regulator